jgi:hypothetical protein
LVLKEVESVVRGGYARLLNITLRNANPKLRRPTPRLNTSTAIAQWVTLKPDTSIYWPS